MTLRLDNLTREIEKSKLRQKILIGATDQQRDILLAVAERVGVEVNLPSRIKIEWKLEQDIQETKWWAWNCFLKPQNAP